MKAINKEQLLKKMRIAWLVLLVATLALLSIGIYNLISNNPFVGKIGAIIMTALGGFCGMITFFLTVFSFLVPAVMKYSQVMSGFDGKLLRNTSPCAQLQTAAGMLPSRKACLTCIFLVKLAKIVLL